MPGVTDELFGEEDAGEAVKIHIDEKEQADFFAALLHHYFEPTVFFMKSMEALKKSATEPLYEESNGCTKEFMTLQSIL